MGESPCQGMVRVESPTISEQHHRPWRGVAPVSCVLAFLALTAGVAGIGSKGDGRAPLVGRTFLSQSVTVAGEPRPLLAGTQVTLAFQDDGFFWATAGCNRHGGRVVIERDRIRLDNGFMTAAGCGKERGEQDQWLSDVLDGDLGYVLDGPSLRFTSNETTIELLDSEVADPDRPLQGTRWRLEAMINRSTRPTQGVVATIVFDGGRVEVTIEGCNDATGHVTITSNEIRVDALVNTDRACGRAEATVQTAITTVLDGTIHYSIDAAVLRLPHPNGEELHLRAR